MTTIKISKGLKDLIEQLHYENTALSDLILFLSRNNLDMNDTNFKYIYEQYLNKNMEYNIAKNNLVEQYNLNQFKKWKLNFITSEIECEN